MMVYPIHDNPMVMSVTDGVMGSLFILGMASLIGYQTKRWARALTIGVVLATLSTLHFSNVQARVILDDDYVTVQNLYSGGFRMRKDEIVVMRQFRDRGGGISLVLTTVKGQECGIGVGGRRREQLEAVLVRELGLTAVTPSFGLSRWARMGGLQ